MSPRTKLLKAMLVSSQVKQAATAGALPVASGLVPLAAVASTAPLNHSTAAGLVLPQQPQVPVELQAPRAVLEREPTEPLERAAL